MIKPLSKELQEKAIKELNEDPDRVEGDIKNIKEWMRQQPYLNGREDDQWILGFLRACKFSLESTKVKLDQFYTLKSLWSEYTVCRNPFSPEIQEILNLEIGIPLPQPINSTEPLLLWSRCNKINLDSITLDTFVSKTFMTNSICLLEYPNFSVSGVIFILDLKDLPLNPILHFNPNLNIIKKLIFCVKSATPLRFKGAIILNMPSVLEWVFNFAKSFFPKKLRDRIHTYNEANIQNLQEHIPKKYIPREYGGENASLAELHENWKKHFESYADWFEEDVKYCTNESLRPGKSIFEDELGIEGSFRKLNVD